MKLANYFDHTLLKADCTRKDILAVCQEAKKYQFAAVCVPPYYVNLATNELDDTQIKVATVIGFPLGYPATAGKVEEIKRAINDGADELDVVLNIAALKNGDWNFVQSDLDSMTTAVRLRSKQIKAIIETAILSEEEIKKACIVCREVGVDFIKTSTGYQGGASVDAVKLIKESVKDSNIKIKASGGIRKVSDAVALIEAGADRLGSSSAVAIVQEEK
ncbi:MAG: deoxyribose-phosphate aldolase [Saprospiraceae bacterium]|jgi:deoxyribose-phosphate aldolase|nr:deoxyribose-phosphate aldolase [Saprospiraceae bacterium]